MALPKDSDGYEIRVSDLVLYEEKVWKVIGFSGKFSKLSLWNAKVKPGNKTKVDSIHCQWLGEDTITLGEKRYKKGQFVRSRHTDKVGRIRSTETPIPKGVQILTVATIRGKLDPEMETSFTTHLDVVPASKPLYWDSAVWYMRKKEYFKDGDSNGKTATRGPRGERYTSEPDPRGGELITVGPGGSELATLHPGEVGMGRFQDYFNNDFSKKTEKPRRPRKVDSIDTGELIEDEVRRLKKGEKSKSKPAQEEAPIKGRKGTWP